jgi:hypothetical protein
LPFVYRYLRTGPLFSTPGGPKRELGSSGCAALVCEGKNRAESGSGSTTYDAQNRKQKQRVTCGLQEENRQTEKEVATGQETT